MKTHRLIACLLGIILALATADARKVKINVRTPGTLAQLVKEKDRPRITHLALQGSIDDTDIAFIGQLPALTTLEFPPMAEAPRPVAEKLPNVRHLIFSDVDYVSGSTFYGCQNLETLTFNGLVGHSDGYCVDNCPRLTSIRFRGPVLSTGGALYASHCPALRTISFENLVVCTGFGDTEECPAFQGYRVTGEVIKAYYDPIAVTPAKDYGRRVRTDHVLPAIHALQKRLLLQGNRFMKKIARSNLSPLADYAAATGHPALADSFRTLKPADSDDGLSYLQILQRAAAYKRTGRQEPVFVYTPPTDSMLQLTRQYFNLDSIAGQGDDFERARRLMYWLHDAIRHDGSSSWPDCAFNARELYEVCRREGRGLNCRFLAFMLNELLLAEGIPARYLTCQSKAWDSDPDCHVINVAWSHELGKWVWLDPSFAAYVTDENGLPLHPGEVRERLRDGRPLVLNDDANWNHEQKQTADNYLRQYMAKNLYVISANTISQPEPEGRSARPQGQSVALVPDGFEFGGTVTTDDAYFWQAPPAGR